MKAIKVGPRGSGVGQYGNFTIGGRTGNLYRWKCAHCGKVYDFRWAAYKCYDSHGEKA